MSTINISNLIGKLEINGVPTEADLLEIKERIKKALTEGVQKYAVMDFEAEKTRPFNGLVNIEFMACKEYEAFFERELRDFKSVEWEQVASNQSNVWYNARFTSVANALEFIREQHMYISEFKSTDDQN